MIRHLASIAEIVDDMEAAVRFYREVLGLTVEHEPGSGYGVVSVDGVLHFGLWARNAAAQSAFGDASAADRVPLGFTVGFEVDSVDAAMGTMASAGWDIEQEPKTEPWGQKTSRFFSASGALSEVSETPGARRISQNLRAQAEF